MTGSRLFIVVVVLLVVLFAISLAVKSRSQGQTADSEQTPWAQNLKAKLLGDTPVDPSEIESTCLADHGTAFAFNGAGAVCRAQIRGSSNPVRTMVLTPVPPATFSVQFEPDRADEQAIPVNIRKVTAEKPAKIVILTHGGKLTVASLSPSKTARLRIE
jgi:hypothetical protein